MMPSSGYWLRNLRSMLHLIQRAWRKRVRTIRIPTPLVRGQPGRGREVHTTCRPFGEQKVSRGLWGGGAVPNWLIRM